MLVICDLTFIRVVLRYPFLDLVAHHLWIHAVRVDLGREHCNVIDQRLVCIAEIGTWRGVSTDP